jgi:[acyl-carrier-protein] S-malonyltransferase
MDSAARRMREALKDVKIRTPNIRFINNADAEFLTDPDAIRLSLERQITSCVRWVESVQKLTGLGIDLMIEAGPGKVLAGLVRRITKDMGVSSCETPDEIEKILRKD